MQGIILTGGRGSRLAPLTDHTNKHLLDIGGRPMIYYSLSILVAAGIKDVTLVSNPEHIDRFEKLLHDRFGGRFDSIRFIAQRDKPGIAGSLQMMPGEFRIGPYLLVLADNIVGQSILPFRQKFESKPDSALTLLTPVKTAKAFGVAKIENDRIIEIEEKPPAAQSHWAITGIYFFPEDLFEIAARIKPSLRGEYEVTDILSIYLHQDRLEYQILPFWWVDAGTHESLDEVRGRFAKMKQVGDYQFDDS